MNLCKCGHSHIEYVGDLGKNNDEEGYGIVQDCSQCNCSSYEVNEK